jgi:hypothetical protein
MLSINFLLYITLLTYTNLLDGKSNLLFSTLDSTDRVRYIYRLL